MSARQKAVIGKDELPPDILNAARVAGEMPLYRDQAAEWFGHAGRYAEVARLCLEAGDLVGAEHATRKLIAFTKQASGTLREMIEANAVAAQMDTDRGVVERARQVSRETSEAAA